MTNSSLELTKRLWTRMNRLQPFGPSVRLLGCVRGQPAAKALPSAPLRLAELRRNKRRDTEQQRFRKDHISNQNADRLSLPYSAEAVL